MAASPKTTACVGREAMLEAYLDRDLSIAEEHALAEHWKSCAGCREALGHAAQSMRLLRFAGPVAEPGPAFARTVMARIRMADQQRSTEHAKFWQPFVSLGWRFAVTATLAVGLLVTYDAHWGFHQQPDAVTARPILGHDLFTLETATPANRDEALMMVAEGEHGNK